MFKFLTGKRPAGSGAASASPAGTPTNNTAQHTNIQRELVRVVLKDIMRLHGIPLGWLGCEVIIISRRATEDELHIHLVVMKWKERLLRYAPALERQLLTGLDRFDPSVDHSRYVVSWRFAPECGCPFTQMPSSDSWMKSEAAPEAKESVDILDRRSARRPPKAAKAAIKPHAEPKPASSDFSATQIAPFR